MNPICPIEFMHVEITEQAVPGIRPGYYIDVFGNVYNSVTHKYKNPLLAHDGRYYRLELKRKDGSRVHIQAHRLLMLVFRYFPGCEKLEVNHIDGNKHNNSLFNLEWVTHEENMRHATVNKLVLSGENATQSKLTESQVREICEILEGERYVNQFADIAAKYNVAPVTILEIAYGTTWRNVSCEYNINYDDKLNDRFSKEQVHTICQIIQDYGKLDDEVFERIFAAIGITNPTHNIRTRIRRIYNRNPGYFYRISSQYKW